MTTTTTTTDGPETHTPNGPESARVTSGHYTSLGLIFVTDINHTVSSDGAGAREMQSYTRWIIYCLTKLCLRRNWK